MQRQGQILLVFIFFLTPSSASGEHPRSQEAWTALFSRDSPATAAAEMGAVLAACDNDPQKLKSLIDGDEAYRAFAAGWLDGQAAVGDGDDRHEMKFFIRVPRGYDPGRSYPLLLAAHARGGDGKRIGAMMLRLLGGEAEQYVIVAPNLPGEAGPFDARPYQQEAFLKPLTWARVHLNVDDGRIYVAGYGAGGHAAWHLATMNPRLFAAAMPMAGVPWFEGVQVTSTMYLQNLANLPVWAIWGEKDDAEPPALGVVDLCRAAANRLEELQNKNFKGTELPGVGHDGCLPDGDRLRLYLASYRRKAVPKKFSHFFHLDHHARGYYLEATHLAHPAIDFTKRIRAVVPSDGGKPTKADARRAIRKHVEKHLFKMRGELDAASNTLVVRGRAIRTIRLYVAEGMFDLSRPVTIRYWSRKWRGRITPAARCMLSHYAATRDAAALIYNELDLDISGKVTVRFR